MGFNPPSGGNVFQFGPFLEISAGTYVYTPVPWNDPGYLNPPAGNIYFIGCASGGLNAWTFQWSVTNGTSSTGYAYAVQLVRIPEPPEVTYAKTKYNEHEYIEFPGADGYYVKVPSPKDASGNVQWGVDGGFNIGMFPWSYTGDFPGQLFAQFTANSGALAVPPANSVPDLNGTFQSFYSDNPNRKLSLPVTSKDFIIELNNNWRFVTHLVWHPDGGIPISLAQYHWSLDCNVYNSTADKTPTVLNGRQTASNWDLTKAFQTLGDNSFVPDYLEWFYNMWDYRDNVRPGIFIKRPTKATGGAPNLAPMGSGSMNGPVTVPNFGNLALLPRGAAANVGGMNSV